MSSSALSSSSCGSLSVVQPDPAIASPPPLFPLEVGGNGHRESFSLLGGDLVDGFVCFINCCPLLPTAAGQQSDPMGVSAAHCPLS